MSNTPLPKRRVVDIRHNTYKLKDFIHQSDEFIKLAKTTTILVDYDTAVHHLDLLKHILSLLKISQINCLDYESALFLESHLEEDVALALVDDYENKDRSYIDTTKFVRHRVYVPLSYFMWDIVFQDSCNIRCMRLDENDTMASINGDNILYRKILEELKKIIEDIDAKELTDLDKCILVSNYLQSKVQYVGEGGKAYADKVYVVDACEEDTIPSKVGSISSVIQENYGLCIAIANATTLLLNNPVFNVNVRSVYGSSHAWNVVVLDGRKYYMDNTWAITRNSNRVSGALKATSFSDNYLLFGDDKAKKIGQHDSKTYLNGDLASSDFSRAEIQKRVRALKPKHKFDYPSTLRFKSHVESS